MVTCFSHGKDAAQETVSICREYGVRAEAYCCDVAEEADVIRLFASIKEEFDGVDVLVNNAGITRDGLILKMNQKDFSEVISTNLNGTFLCSREAAKQMLRKRSGRIINISSVVGLRGNAGQVNYASSKAGVIGLAKSLAKELGGNVVADSVDSFYLVDNLVGYLCHEVVGKMGPVGGHCIGGGDGTKGYRMLVGALVAHDSHTAHGGEQDCACLPYLVVEAYLDLAVGHCGGHSGG